MVHSSACGWVHGGVEGVADKGGHLTAKQVAGSSSWRHVRNWGLGKPGRTSVSGSFWENGHHRTHFEAHLALGETQRFEIAGNRTVEIGMMKSGKSTVKLVDPKGHALHFAALSSDTQPFRIAVCNTRIELASPAGRADLICAARS